jgi:hypothetical protein
MAAGRVWRRAHRDQRESATEERMRRVGDLDLDDILTRWILEVGIN